MMNEIRQMIENGESETVEFKENFDKEAVETAVAYLLNLGLNERQIKAVRYIKEKGKITISSFKTIAPGVSAKTLYRDLQELINKRDLKEFCEKRGRRYELAYQTFIEHKRRSEEGAKVNEKTKKVILTSKKFP